MFPAPSAIDLSHSLFDLTAKDNEARWKSLFLTGLKRVMEQTNQSMKAKGDALEYVERLLVQLLGMICTRPCPHTVPDVQDRVHQLFPHPVEEWAIEEANKAVKHGRKKSDSALVFPVDKIHPLLKELMQHKIDHNVTIYICAVLEYIAADVLHLVGNYVKHSRRGEFSTQDIKAAVCCDKVLCDLFKLGDNFTLGVDEEPATTYSLSYNEVVEDLLQSERQYLRDLQMLLKVFREQLADKLVKDSEQLESVFQSIEDIAELTITLISQVEDTIEMTEPNITPSIGICFLELAENWDFDVYDRYAEAYDSNCRQMLQELLSRPDVEKRVSTAGRGFVDAIKFYFPKLLLEPFYHCTQYFDFIKLLDELSPSEKDKSDLSQADSVLTRLKTAMLHLSSNIPKKLGDSSNHLMRISCKRTKAQAQQKVQEVRALVDGFEDCFVQSYFNEFFCEGELLKVSSGRRVSDRFAYLFDGCIFLCKPTKAQRIPGSQSGHEYRLKEYFYLTRVEVQDKEDTEEMKNVFELVSTAKDPGILLSCRTFEEKRGWMAMLVMLTKKSMLDRILDRIIGDEEKKHPLRLPPVEKYRFSVEDSEDNIVFDKDNGNHFLIKGATLLKLVERLTHHQYSDPNFCNTFLTTYRSFCSPHEFLDLLIERFNIPDPEMPAEDAQESIHAREMLKRFRKEYSRHIQLRVLNVIKQWVMHHFYDFERDSSLQRRLEGFLSEADETRGKNGIIESVRRSIKKSAESLSNDWDRGLSAVKSPPPIEYHIRCNVAEWNILTLHPIELARQLTLLEFDYYRVVKPSELVGSVWTKKNKDQLSPNLLKMIKHTTNVTRWFEKTIVDTENIEERTAVVSRILEVMIVLQELNNFNGVVAVVSAMGSASVHRLSFTFQKVSQKLQEALEEAQELQNDHYKKYQERLRSINPPCVPFFGMYLTNILHIEDGNKDFLFNSKELINFSKRGKVAEITSEIRQFQYSHYTYSVEPQLRKFIEDLQPFPTDQNENEISNYLWTQSLRVEPRGAAKAPQFQRRWPRLSLKSPGIKRIGRSHPGPLSLNSLNFGSASRSNLSGEEGLSMMILQPSGQTPSTPSSLPSSSPQENDGDHCIFAPVLIVPNSNSTHSQRSQVNQYPVPPPLPPRPQRRNDSFGDSLSPRNESGGGEMPPPLPPRRASPRTPNPPIPRRNSATATPAELSPHANQPPISPPKRLTNGPQLNTNTNTSSPAPSGLSCGSEHTHSNSNSRFVFSSGSPMGSPLTPIPPSPPKLPPKSVKGINVGSPLTNHNPL